MAVLTGAYLEEIVVHIVEHVPILQLRKIEQERARSIERENECDDRAGKEI